MSTSSSTVASAPSGAAAGSSPLPRYVVISALAVPVMVIGQFAMLAIVPVALVVIGVLRHSDSRPLRWSTAALAALYATALVIWAGRDNPAPSLSKDIDPLLTVLIVAASVAVLVSTRLRRRRGCATGALNPPEPDRAPPPLKDC